MSEACTLCAELEGDLENNLFHHLFAGSMETRIWKETSNLVVMPTLGPLVEGHLLILTKEHYLSMGHLPESLYAELTGVTEWIRSIMERELQPPLFFEHGPVSRAKTGGACVDHAHLHVLPAAVNLRTELRELFQEKVVQSLSDLRNQVVRDIAYIYFEDPRSNRYVYDINEVIPSQFMRRLVARRLNLGNTWDWRIHPAKQRFLDTMALLETWSHLAPPDSSNKTNSSASLLLDID